MKFQLTNRLSERHLVLTEQCFGAIGTYASRVLVLCHDAPAVAKKHGLVLWDDDRVGIPFHGDMLDVNDTLYSDWEIMP